MRNCSLFVSAALALLVLVTPAVAGRKKQTVTQIETHNEVLPIPKGARFEFSRSVRPGRLVKAREGRAGSVIRTWRITYKDEQVVSKELLKEEKVDAQPTLFLMSRAGFETSRGAFMRSKVMSMRATAYDPSPATIGRGATGRAANGMRAAYGIVAVDPRVIPLGSLVYVEGYGFAIAADTGGAIKGNRIDLCYNSRHEACSYGSHRVRVHLLKPR